MVYLRPVIVVYGSERVVQSGKDVILDIPQDEASKRKDEILQAVRVICGKKPQIKRYAGELL